ncbi:MAG: glycosyltransferase [Patescibacteria group bacterium]
MKKPSILIIGTADTIGGAAQQSWALGHELINRGYVVKWLVRTKKSNKNYVQGFFNNWHTNYSHLRNFLLSNDLSFGLEKEILDHPWYKQTEIVHLQNLHGNYFKLETIIKISKEKKLVWTLHDMWAITGKSPYLINKKEEKLLYPPMMINKSKNLKKEKQKIYQQLQNLVTISPSIWLNDLVKKSSLKKFTNKVIYNGVDTDKFKPKTLTHQKKIITVVISGGFQSPYKGGELVKKLIPYIQKLDLELHFVGSNKQEKINNLVYHGQLNQQQLINQYQQSTAILVPSLADNCPMVIMEALACGLSVIATNVGGIPELITHKENGFLAEPTTKSLLTSINWLLKLDKKQLQMIRENNRQKAVKQFSLKKMVDQYEQLYHSLSS